MGVPLIGLEILGLVYGNSQNKASLFTPNVVATGGPQPQALPEAKAWVDERGDPTGRHSWLANSSSCFSGDPVHVPPPENSLALSATDLFQRGLFL